MEYIMLLFIIIIIIIIIIILLLLLLSKASNNTSISDPFSCEIFYLSNKVVLTAFLYNFLMFYEKQSLFQDLVKNIDAKITISGYQKSSKTTPQF